MHPETKSATMMIAYSAESFSIGLGSLDASDQKTQQDLATKVQNMVNYTSDDIMTTPIMLVLWGALYHKLKHLTQFAGPFVGYFETTLEALSKETSDCKPFLEKMLAFYPNASVVWFREIGKMKPSWAMRFRDTDDYIVDLGSGQMNVVETKTGVQVPGFQVSFNFETANLDEILASIKRFVE